MIADHEAQAHTSRIAVTRGGEGAKDPCASAHVCPVRFCVFHPNVLNGPFHWIFGMLASVVD